MSNVQMRPSGWSSIIPNLSEEGLLLAEMTHRVANEVSAATAAVRLAMAAKGSSKADLLQLAAGRLAGFGEVLSVLNVPSDGVIEIGSVVDRLCEGLCAARFDVTGNHITFDTVQLRVDGMTALRTAEQYSTTVAAG